MASTAAFLRSGLGHPRQVLLLAMVAAWGLRLAIHILVRNWGREEDFRARNRFGATHRTGLQPVRAPCLAP